jgi:predicted transcriptional regulator
MTQHADAQRAAFVEALEAERKARGLSCREVAREAGVHPSAMHRLVHGQDVMAGNIWKLFGWLDSQEDK